MPKHKKTIKLYVIETFIISLLLTGVSLVVIGLLKQKPQVPLVAVSLPVAASSPAPSSTPSTFPSEPVPIATGINPDDTATLSLKKQLSQSTTIYILSTTKATDPVEKLLFTTQDLGQTLSIPLNTWSPDNKYVFIKEDSPDRPKYYVFKANETTVEEPVNILDLFSKKYTEYTVTDITGWAAPGLLVLNTDKNTGGVGPSFWYDVTNQTFTQLSTRFN